MIPEPSKDGARPPSFLQKYLYVLGDYSGKLTRMVALFVAVSIFDTVTIGLIGPFVGALLSPAALARVPLLPGLFGVLGLETSRQQLLFLAGILLVLSIVKGVTVFGVQWRVMGFSFGFRDHLVRKLMRAYLRMPYQFYLARNSAGFIQSVTAHTKVLADDLLIPSLRLVSDGTMVLTLGLFLLWVNAPAVLLLAAMLGAALGGYVRFVRPIVHRAGGEVAVTHEQIIRGVSEGIGGIKEIRVLRAEQSFLDTVAEASGRQAGAQQRFNALLVMPKYLMEAVITLFVILFSTYVILAGASGAVLIGTLAVFAAAAMRILPAISTVSASLASMNYSRFALDALYDDLRLIEREAAEALNGSWTAAPAITGPAFERLEVERISYRYPTGPSSAIDRLSLDIAQGQSIGLIGKSGAGKTTLVDILLGLHPFDSGAMRINGRPVAEFGWDAWIDNIAYIPQHVFLVDGSIERNVAFGVPDGEIDRERVRDALRQAQLEELVARLPDGADTQLGERGVRLSGGERQRIGLARAFYRDRQVLILDEATSALDNATERHVTDVIRRIRGEKTLIVIAHRLTTVRDCDVIHRLEGGKIVHSGSYDEVIGEQS